MKSITNTKKITKAMELVSAAKMRKAVEAALRTRSYARLAQELMARLSSADQTKISLLERRPVEKILFVVVTSNRGLCGSFNTNMLKKMIVTLQHKERLAENKHSDVACDMIGIGKKSVMIAKKTGLNLTALFDRVSERPTFADLLPVFRMTLDGFLQKTYDKVYIAYTDYRSSLAQEPRIRQLLPVSPADIETMIQTAGPNQKEDERHTAVEHIDLEQYLFEPDMTGILNAILPRLVETQLYQAVLESSASEHSARMVAMKSASDAAGDMLQELRLSFNKARQAAITREISEIVGGAAALE